MTERLKPKLCVIGAGAAGLAVAAAAAAFGVPTVLIEKGRPGGQSLNAGSIPAKAMIAAARRAEMYRDSARFGIRMAQPEVAFDAVNDYVHRVIDAVAPNVSRERLAGLGVRTVEGSGRFRDPRTVVVGAEHDITHEIEAERFVIATGSQPFVPAIPGLEQVPYFTNESIFEAREQPQHLIILGGNAHALELAQAFRRLGSEVTVLERGEPLDGEDGECVAIVLDALAREGVTVRGGAKVARLRRLRQRIEVVLESGETIHGSDLLLAADRQPNLDGLGLVAAEVKYEPDGILVDKSFRTTNKRVYAIGDVTRLPKSTHSAQHQAALLVRHLALRQPIAMRANGIPRTAFTDPELAHVGLTAEEARGRRRKIQVLRWSYRENDRAQAEGQARGHIKVVTDRNGAILGATIVGALATEQIGVWTLAIANNLNIRNLAEVVMPYPTYSAVGKRAAISFFTPRLAASWVRRLLNLLPRFG